MVSAQELSRLRHVIELLKPLERVTVELGAEKNTSISKVTPMSNILTQCHYKLSRAPVPENDETARGLQTRLLQHLNQSLGRVEHVRTYAVATILDPRFKNKSFDSPAACAGAISAVKELMREAVLERERTPSPQPPLQAAPPEDDFWGEHDQQVAAQQLPTPTMTVAGMPTELKIYLDQPLEPRQSNPVKYWAEQTRVFPVLAPVALHYAVIPATSVPSERLFSEAGATSSERRSRISPKHLRALLFLSGIAEQDWGGL
ncbi:Zinc finger BED domain-containing protein 4 [Frankliniella fusca]|uniref:Zinc finger BED domain-containing protein 4 n=1 Tax=Frankliniella fusca TaxID=407009 RepID=A0AAE1HSK1_9NEOP|nr:Zinc finger BED domain-containing protein 4 [Frankliniella fusca]